MDHYGDELVRRGVAMAGRGHGGAAGALTLHSLGPVLRAQVCRPPEAPSCCAVGARCRLRSAASNYLQKTLPRPARRRPRASHQASR